LTGSVLEHELFPQRHARQRPWMQPRCWTEGVADYVDAARHRHPAADLPLPAALPPTQTCRPGGPTAGREEYRPGWYVSTLFVADTRGARDAAEALYGTAGGDGRYRHLDPDGCVTRRARHTTRQGILAEWQPGGLTRTATAAERRFRPRDIRLQPS